MVIVPRITLGLPVPVNKGIFGVMLVVKLRVSVVLPKGVLRFNRHLNINVHEWQ